MFAESSLNVQLGGVDVNNGAHDELIKCARNRRTRIAAHKTQLLHACAAQLSACVRRHYTIPAQPNRRSLCAHNVGGHHLRAITARSKVARVQGQKARRLRARLSPAHLYDTGFYRPVLDIFCVTPHNAQSKSAVMQRVRHSDDSRCICACGRGSRLEWPTT